jgi:hypothetical protein
VFILPRDRLPEEPDDLARALEQGLRAFVSRPHPIVTIRGDNIQELDAILLDFSGAEVHAVQQPPPIAASNTTPAVKTRDFSVTGRPLHVFGSQIAFELRAEDLEFNQAQQADGKVVLVLHRAASGDFRFDASRAELEKLIKATANQVAAKQGITIESIELELDQSGPRSIGARVTLSARKLVFRAGLQLAGTVTISNDLIARVSGLRCSGDGAIAALACTAISSQFRRIENRPLPLAALPIGQTQLRDLQMNIANDRIVISAQFGDRPRV